MEITDFEFENFLSASGWYVAISGGTDSMVLLHQVNRLQRLNPSIYPKLEAIHVNHGLHKDADLWESHCSDFCSAHDISFYAERVHVKNEGDGIESAARESRYRVFEKYLPPSSVLFVGHHLEDQVETFFLRLMRGAGLKGLRSISKSRSLGEVTIIRPLLKISRSRLEDYARQHNISTIEDSSNSDLSLDRNFLRHQVLPMLESRWPGYRKTILRAISHFEDADQMLVDLLPKEADIKNQFGDPGLSMASIKDEGERNARLLVRRFLTEQRVSMPNQASLNEFVRQLFYGREGSSATLQIRDRKIQRFREGIFLLPMLPKFCDKDSLTLFPNKIIDVEGIGSITLRCTLNQRVSSKGDAEVILCWRGSKLISQSRRLRSKVKKLFNAKAIPPWWRERVPIAVKDEKLIAIGVLKHINLSLPNESDCFLEWYRSDGM